MPLVNGSWSNSSYLALVLRRRRSAQMTELATRWWTCRGAGSANVWPARVHCDAKSRRNQKPYRSSGSMLGQRHIRWPELNQRWRCTEFEWQAAADRLQSNVTLPPRGVCNRRHAKWNRSDLESDMKWMRPLLTEIDVLIYSDDSGLYYSLWWWHLNRVCHTRDTSRPLSSVTEINRSRSGRPIN